MKLKITFAGELEYEMMFRQNRTMLSVVPHCLHRSEWDIPPSTFRCGCLFLRYRWNVFLNTFIGLIKCPFLELILTKDPVIVSHSNSFPMGAILSVWEFWFCHPNHWCIWFSLFFNLKGFFWLLGEPIIFTFPVLDFIDPWAKTNIMYAETVGLHCIRLGVSRILNWLTVYFRAVPLCAHFNVDKYILPALSRRLTKMVTSHTLSILSVLSHYLSAVNILTAFNDHFVVPCHSSPTCSPL